MFCYVASSVALLRKKCPIWNNKNLGPVVQNLTNITDSKIPVLKYDKYFDIFC